LSSQVTDSIHSTIFQGKRRRRLRGLVETDRAYCSRGASQTVKIECSTIPIVQKRKCTALQTSVLLWPSSSGLNRFSLQLRRVNWLDKPCSCSLTIRTGCRQLNSSPEDWRRITSIRFDGGSGIALTASRRFAHAHYASDAGRNYHGHGSVYVARAGAREDSRQARVAASRRCHGRGLWLVFS
jgi:hypothetical protein